MKINTYMFSSKGKNIFLLNSYLVYNFCFSIDICYFTLLICTITILILNAGGIMVNTEVDTGDTHAHAFSITLDCP